MSLPITPAERPSESELLELFFSQSLTGAFFMMLDEPVRWDDTVDKHRVLDYVFTHQRITRVNNAMLAQYGTTPEGLIGRTPAEFYAHDIPQGRDVWRRFFDTGRLVTETDERRVDGTPVRIEGEYICLYTADRSIAGHFGVQRDVTERYRAEQALRESEGLFSAAFRLSPFRLTLNRLDDGSFIEVNDTFLRDLRRTRDEVIGKTSVELGLWADPSDRDRYIERLRREHTITELEFGGYLRDGRREITQISSTIIDVGGVPCVLTHAHDVTDRRHAEQELEYSHQQLRALASRLQRGREEERRTIAREIHDELGQSLTGIKLQMAWVQAHLKRPDHGVRDRLMTAMQRIDGTIDSVRRIATQLRPALLDDLGLVAALEWVVQDFGRTAGVRTLVHVPADDPPVNADCATAIFRIVQESLTNVARHAAATEVEFSFKEHRGTLQVVVRDNGRGVTHDQLADSRSLGLLGLRERAMSVGGLLEISGAPGQGTEVRLTLPIAG